MSDHKAAYFLWGAAAGIAVGAALIGIGLAGLGLVMHLLADTPSVLTQHPLVVSGSELLTRSLLLAVPLLALRVLWRGVWLR